MVSGIVHGRMNNVCQPRRKRTRLFQSNNAAPTPSTVCNATERTVQRILNTRTPSAVIQSKTGVYELNPKNCTSLERNGNSGLAGGTALPVKPSHASRHIPPFKPSLIEMLLKSVIEIANWKINGNNVNIVKTTSPGTSQGIDRNTSRRLKDARASFLFRNLLRLSLTFSQPKPIVSAAARDKGTVNTKIYCGHLVGHSRRKNMAMPSQSAYTRFFFQSCVRPNAAKMVINRSGAMANTSLCHALGDILSQTNICQNGKFAP